MRKNGAGKLFSIDLSIESPKNDVTGFDWPSDVPIGYLIPSDFKKNHELIFGDSVIELPKLLTKKKSEGINFDLFFHDSDHSYSHMTYEFSIVDKYVQLLLY